MPSRDFLVGLVAVVAALAGRLLAPRTRVPYACYLVVIGAGASFIPGLPAMRLQPDVVFDVILPPLVYRAGFVSSPRELRENATSIALSAFGLVLATTAAVAAAAELVSPSLGWAGAAVLGAAVAPTDPVSATTVLARIGAPRRLATILEGEGLVNDGIALTLLAVGIAAVSTPVSPASVLADFLKLAAGGIAFGAAAGFALARARRVVQDGPAQIVLSLVSPYLAYLGAEALGLSGILAAVTAGVCLGQARAVSSGPGLRLRTESFWETATFLLESWLFVLVGLQFRSVVQAAGRYPLHVPLELCCATVGAAVLVRMLWQLLIPSLRWRPADAGRLFDTGPLRLGQRFVLGWAGLRGAISLAAALSVPTTVAGRPFPGREFILLATFCVIAFTLVGLGSTLPFVITALHIGAAEDEQKQTLRARRHSLEAALRRLGELAASGEVDDDTATVLCQLYQRRMQRVDAGLDPVEPGQQPRSVEEVERELFGAQRSALRGLYQRGEIDYTVLRESLHDLDLAQASSHLR
jgi:Na+/H+ antiporter